MPSNIIAEVWKVVGKLELRDQKDTIIPGKDGGVRVGYLYLDEVLPDVVRFKAADQVEFVSRIEKVV